jgi:hypothetical protein
VLAALLLVGAQTPALRTEHMDRQRCAALKARLKAQPADRLVSLDEFFAGNDDLGSVGCNLFPHPGVECFKDTLDRLAGRADVDAVHVLIYDADPGEGSWPNSDLILVVGCVPPDELAEILAPLSSDEIESAETWGLPDQVLARLGSPAWVVWWD